MDFIRTLGAYLFKGFDDRSRPILWAHRTVHSVSRRVRQASDPTPLFKQPSDQYCSE